MREPRLMLVLAWVLETMLKAVAAACGLATLIFALGLMGIRL